MSANQSPTRVAAGSGAAAVRVELRQPAPDLAFEVGPGVREVAETARVPVDRVDVCERVDELVAAHAAAPPAAAVHASGTLLRTGTPSMRAIT